MATSGAEHDPATESDPVATGMFPGREPGQTHQIWSYKADNQSAKRTKYQYTEHETHDDIRARAGPSDFLETPTSTQRIPSLDHEFLMNIKKWGVI